LLEARQENEPAKAKYVASSSQAAAREGGAGRIGLGPPWCSTVRGWDVRGKHLGLAQRRLAVGWCRRLQVGARPARPNLCSLRLAAAHSRHPHAPNDAIQGVGNQHRQVGPIHQHHLGRFEGPHQRGAKGRTSRIALDDCPLSAKPIVVPSNSGLTVGFRRQSCGWSAKKKGGGSQQGVGRMSRLHVRHEGTRQLWLVPSL
jgi:hypothetical protein